ncbi:putative aldouronate transport system substrate-binding protein [Paenibacillus sp. UNCCL117]|uniref:extracellular solute-binding protein n=1 Tax=unclassified Paenibacillus TaxID=185978 RepID=UPI00087F570C|nr:MULTISPECIES: extracellular solute-binding protein [unclassified Paenibacillus]SDC91024.1 carbohydrate ABC transporter substrate-binding protein, CUT1 family [Paenibacillus sp. cl123]SFW28977.1 putative aldouronate transport system substrate-binding protein [Paenibacillus sp. UNCCL117]
MKRSVKQLLLITAGLAGIGILTVQASTQRPNKPPGTEQAQKEAGRPTVSIVLDSLGLAFPEGLHENDNPYLDYIEKGTNLRLRILMPPTEGYDEKLNVTMASANRPDLLNVHSDVWVANYVKQGALMPLDDLIDKYGPALRARIPQEAWDKVTYNGRIYAIPSLNEARGVELIYARQDWLDRLGLKPPRTLQEYEDVLRAFTYGDPDGNGKDDTIGLLTTENLGRTGPFFGAFGVQLGQWMERDGQLVYADVQPEMKQALAYLHKLYAERLIDPEFPINKNKNLEQKIVSGKVGMFSAAWYDTRGPLDLHRKNDPAARWIPLEYPVGPEGKSGTYASPLVREYNVIPAQSARGAEAVRFLNFIAGEGHHTLKLGFENEVWRASGDEMETNFDEHLRQIYRGIYSSLVEIPEPEITKKRLDSLGKHFNLYDNLQRIESHLIPNRFNGLPTPAMGKYNQKLSALQDAFIRMIAGVTPLDQFEAYAKWWEQEGGQEITREVNEWYRMTKKGER